MTTPTLKLRLLSLILAGAIGAGMPAAAQENLFAPRIIVNDRAITQYEVDQRALFLQLLRSPGNPQEQALKDLIDDRLRLFEAERLGIELTEEQVKGGMEEFASRANLSAEEFLEALAQGGVEPEAFRDFVSAGIAWREVVRARYAGQITISDADVDEAINRGAQETKVRVLLSELVIPLRPGEEESAIALAARLQDEITSEGGFAAAASRYSAAPTAGRGGRLDWLPLENLPPQIAPFILALGPGDVSDPVQVPNAVVLFQLRDIAEEVGPAESGVLVEYGRLSLPADGSRDAEVLARLDTCKDLFGVNRGLPPEQLPVETKTLAEIPQDIGYELAKLDPGETVVLARGAGRELLMLCGRAPVTETPISREGLREQLINQRLGALADLYLAEIKANAIIREP